MLDGAIGVGEDERRERRRERRAEKDGRVEMKKACCEFR